jgi:hypothetical protein
LCVPNIVGTTRTIFNSHLEVLCGWMQGKDRKNNEAKYPKCMSTKWRYRTCVHVEHQKNV